MSCWEKFLFESYWASGKIRTIRGLILRELEKDVIEIICEYNLEFVKEEKRVVENDEILAEHHVDRAIFNKKFKIIKYENLE